MQLTEPQAGSDVGALRTRAERAADGSYRITGQKIFITYGEHDLTDNIIHFVLARLPDAPPGTRGISLFLVPKFLLNADGSLGARNDVRAHSIEHKLGIHASPTCTMVFGDNGGATGFLIGEENRGMACMFTMMNQARLAVGLQGVAHRRARDPAGACLCARAQAGPRRRQRRRREPDHRASRRQAHAAHHARAHPRRARDLLRHRGRARPRPARHRRRGAHRRARARLAAHAGRQGVLDRHRHRGRLARRAGARRHGLHRGDRRRPALPRCPHPGDLRGHQRHPGDRPGDPQAAAVGRRRGATPISPRCGARSTRSMPPTIRPSAPPARGSRRRSTASSARPQWLLGRRRTTPTPRSPAPRPICGCSRWRPAARCLAEEALAAARMAGNGADAAARIAHRALFRREHRGRRPRGLERTVVEGADSVNAAEAALA